LIFNLLRSNIFLQLPVSNVDQCGNKNIGKSVCAMRSFASFVVKWIDKKLWRTLTPFIGFCLKFA